jgi:hypothetical protein
MPRKNMNPELENRLYNFKFNSALNHLDGEPIEVRKIVEQLSKKYGDCGWIFGTEGDRIDKILKKIGVDC